MPLTATDQIGHAELDHHHIQLRLRYVSPYVFFVCVFLVLVCIFPGECRVVAQDAGSELLNETTGQVEPEVSGEVGIKPEADDEDIATRLTRILKATNWFERPHVKVDEGVVFLSGRVDSEAHQEWATRLASKTQAVVAVVNNIQVIEASMWDLTPAWDELKRFTREAVRSSPLVLFALLLLFLTWVATRWSIRVAAWLLRGRIQSQLLRDVTARVAGVPVFLFGLYLVLKVSGLTRLAVTVLGGTGLVGLVVGFAFRDIAENFLASILMSVQHPFARGDLVEVAGCQGFVQSINTRSTLLMTLEGNHVQIPNATIYKETIINRTANPSSRFDFVVGIGYEDSIAEAQSIILQVLRDHPAVVDDPESLVLVESLGAATINLRVYFWINIREYSQLKVCSAVIRLSKAALAKAGVSMPDEAREVVFPQGVPVQMLPSDQPLDADESSEKLRPGAVEDQAVNDAEGNLTSEAGSIQHQAETSRSPEGGTDLLD